MTDESVKPAEPDVERARLRWILAALALVAMGRCAVGLVRGDG